MKHLGREEPKPRSRAQPREGLYSSYGDRSTRQKSRLEKWFRGGVILLELLVGVPMSGGPGVRVAQAEESEVNRIARVTTVNGQISSQLGAVGSVLAGQAALGVPGATPAVAGTHATVGALLETLAQNAEFLGIPITGSTPDERFRSLNEWLNAPWQGRQGLTGRTRDSPIDATALEELRERLESAVGTAIASIAADALAGVTPDAPVLPELPAPRPAPGPRSPAIVREPAPEEVGTEPETPNPPPRSPPTAAEAEAEAPPEQDTEHETQDTYAQVLSDLELIRQWAGRLDRNGETGELRFRRARGSRTPVERAQRLFDQLTEELNRETPDQTRVDELVQQARELIDGQVSRTDIRTQLQAALANASAMQYRYGQDASVQPHELSPRAEALLSSLLRVAGPNQGLALNIARRVPDIWLLDETSTRSMLELLEQAEDAVSSGDTATATARLAAATQLFDRQQRFYNQFVEDYILATADGSLTEIRERGSQLPLLARLPSEYRRYELNIEERTYPVQCGREQLEEALQRRVETVRGLRQGAIPYRVMSDLFDAVTADARAVHELIDIVEYAQANGLDQYAQRYEFWRDYSLLVAAIIAPNLTAPGSSPPNFDEAYPPALQDRLIRIHLDREEGPITPTERQDAIADLRARLAQNSEYVYDSLLYSIFTHIRRLAPELGEEQSQQLQQMARVRALRSSIRLERTLYEGHSGPLERELTDYQLRGLGAEQMQALRTIPWSRTDDELEAGRVPLTRAQKSLHRFVVSRDLLDVAIQTAEGSGMAEDDPVLVATHEQLASVESLPAAEQMDATSDALYSAAMNLLLIREAEIWLGNERLRAPNLSPSAVAEAQGLVQLARDSFLWSFSHPGVDPTYHMDLSQRLASDAVLMLAPPALRVTESYGMYATRHSFLNTFEEGIRVDGDAQPTDAQRREAAAAAELRYLSFVVDARDSDGFSRSPASIVMAPVEPELRLLGLNVGRALPLDTPDRFPRYPFVWRRESPSGIAIDRHVGSGGDATQYLEGQAQRREDYFRDMPHEDVRYYYCGYAYSELYRLVFAHGDTGTPAILLGFELAPNAGAHSDALRRRLGEIAGGYGLPADRPLLDSLRERMLTASAEYATALTLPAGEQRDAALARIQRDANQLLLAVLDVRIAQLEDRLGGSVTLTDGGEPVRVRDLERSESAGAYYVVRAREALAAAQELRAQYVAASGGMDPLRAREAIAIAEIGLESLSDGHILSLSRPPRPTEFFAFGGTPGVEVQLTRAGASGRDRMRATVVSTVVIRNEDDVEETIDDYERRTGQQGVEQGLNYVFFLYLPTGRTDPRTHEATYLLLDPRESADSERAVVGITMTLADDRRVVVQASARRSRGSQITWEAATDDGGNPIVLFELRSEPGSLRPTPGTEGLNRAIASVGIFGNADRRYVEIPRRDGIEVAVIPTGRPEGRIGSVPVVPATQPYGGFILGRLQDLVDRTSVGSEIAMPATASSAARDALMYYEILRIVRGDEPAEGSPTRALYDAAIRRWGNRDRALQALSAAHARTLDRLSPLPHDSDTVQGRADVLALPSETRARLLAMLQDVNTHMYDDGYRPAYDGYENAIVTAINLLSRQ